MTPEPASDNSPEWARVESLFHAALEHPPGEQITWVDAQAQIAASTRAEAKSLLAAFHRHQVLSETAPQSQVTDEPRLPERFGPYRPVRLLGRGGMGVVYLARRDDGQFDQLVAVKTILATFADTEFLRRFQTERQLLATLNHPHITRLLDGGLSSAGDPYLVTEYVEGAALDRYSDAQKLDVRQRIKLFLQVCNAVGYAHRNLILHRDLKPANIMVTNDGVVKLLDFGTASLIDNASVGTLTQAPLLTPRYASPEQLRGERAGVGCDVYSLGVVLFELLTGETPFGESNSVVGQLNRASGDTNPSTLSVAVTEEAAVARGTSRERLRKQLAGDLQAVVGKALEGKPAARYQSVPELAADLENYLIGNPVKARPQTAIYRTGKFLRRHWLPVAAAVLFVGAISTTAAIALQQAKAARAEAARAEKLIQFLSEMMGPGGRTFNLEQYTVVQMLESAEKRLQKGGIADPLTEAILRKSLGESFTIMDRRPQAKQQLQLALAVFEKLGYHEDAASVLNSLAINARQDGHFGEALDLVDQALSHVQELGKRALPKQKFNIKHQRARILGTFLGQRLDEVEATLTEIIAMAKQEPSISREALAAAMDDLGALKLDAGKTSEAVDIFRQALDIGRSENPGGRWESNALSWLALVNFREERYGAAAEYSRQRFQLLSKQLSPNNTDLLVVEADWARARALTGELTESVAQIDRVMPVIEKAFPTPSFSVWIAYRAASNVMSLASRFTEAESYGRQALGAVAAVHLSEKDPRRAESLLVLGVAQRGRKRYHEAHQNLEHAAAIYARCGPAFAARALSTNKLLSETPNQ